MSKQALQVKYPLEEWVLGVPGRKAEQGVCEHARGGEAVAHPGADVKRERHRADFA